jgi:hypothetical protein
MAWLDAICIHWACLCGSVALAANASSNTTSVVLARLVEPAVRSNLVIALGDLAFRFPNLLEPWTERIYGPLSDPDTSKPLPVCPSSCDLLHHACLWCMLTLVLTMLA